MSEFNTLLLYCIVITTSYLFALLSKNRVYTKDGKTCVKLNPCLFFLSFVIPWFFFTFAGMSNDYAEYQHIFDVVTWDNFYRIWIEPGYALLNLLIKVIIDDSVVGIVIIKSITIGLVFKTIYNYRDRVPVDLAVLGYLCYCYLDSFCMIRINLAAAIILYALSCFEIKRVIIKPAVLLFISISIHYSAFIVVFFVMGYWFCTRRKKFSLNSFYLMVFVLIVARLVAVPLVELLTSIVPILEKYGDKYSTISKVGSGVLQYVVHMPFLFIFHQSMRSLYNRQAEDNILNTIGITMAPFSLFFATMGYSMQVIGRSYAFFMYLWAIVIPRFYYTRQNKRASDSIIVYFLIIAWFILKFLIYLQSGSLMSSGIERYFFIW